MLVLHNDAEFWCANLEFDAWLDALGLDAARHHPRVEALTTAVTAYAARKGWPMSRSHDGSRLSGD